MRCIALIAIGIIAASTAGAATAPQADREAILAMAGEFKVTFHFHETLTFDASRTPSADEDSQAHEQVTVIEDRGDYISLQHLLVVEAEGQKMVVKHWRQDWQYEPRFVTEYRGNGLWERTDLKRRDVKGAWSQTVFSVDDSPRYGGIGTWRHEGGLSFWESRETWRPLPRRERDQRKFYEVLVGRNRHTITPTGWAHEQDNYKLDLNESGNSILARETGVNSYERISGYDFSVATDYWKSSSEFWKVVREEWRGLLAERETVTLRNDGQSLGREILGLADELAQGKVTTEQAVETFKAELGKALEGRGEEAGEE